MLHGVVGSWGLVSAGRVLHPSLAHDTAPRESHFIAIVLGDAVRLERQLDGGRWSGTLAIENATCVVPPGRRVAWAARDPLRALNIMLPPAALAHAADAIGPGSVGECALFAHRDPGARRLGEVLADELAEGNPRGPLYVDALTVALGIHVVTAAVHGAVRALPRHRLTPRQAERARAVMHDRFAERLTVIDLAHAVGMGEDHFSRCFRETFGEAPYRYLLRLRMAKACALLADPCLSLSDIGAAVGYESQSAFGAAFRRVIATSPANFRRGL